MKDILLATGYFIDNIWLDKYISLVSKDAKASYKERHHVIPVAIYKYKNGCKTRYDAETIANKDPHNKIVELSFIDHCKAHLYLYNCTIKEIKHSNEVAFKTMIEDKIKIKSTDLTKEEEQTLTEWKNKLLAESRWYWSDDEVCFIKQNYGKLTYVEMAAYLKRTRKAIEGCCNRLGLTKESHWSSAEKQWLKENRRKYSLEECSKLLNRSISSIKHYCLRHNIQAVPCWTAADDAWLKEHYLTLSHKSCAEYLGRSTNAVRCRCSELGLIKHKRK